MRLLARCSLALGLLLAAPRIAHGDAPPAAPSPEAAAAELEASSDGRVFDFFGKTWCWGSATARSDCDVRLGGPPAAPQVEPARSFTLLGLRVCTADAAPAERCDLRLPWSQAPRSERHASL